MQALEREKNPQKKFWDHAAGIRQLAVTSPFYNIMLLRIRFQVVVS